MSKTFMVHKTGNQFILAPMQVGTGTTAGPAAPFNRQGLEAHLLSLGAFPEAIARLKGKFDSGEASVIIEVP